MANPTLLVRIAGDVADLREKTKEAEAIVRSAADGMEEAGRALTASITLPLVAIGAVSVKAGMEMERAMTQVKKTTGQSAHSITALQKEMTALSESLAVEGGVGTLAEIAATGGQLGIASENLSGFVDTIARLSMAQESLSADEAATQMAQFANITRMAQTDFDNLASSLAYLGNRGASTEADIMSMAMRLAGAGSQVGMSEGQIMGFANALSSAGLRAEMGGNAFSKLFSELASHASTGGKELEKFAAVSGGLTGKQFKELFQKDAAAGVTAFIEGLAKLKKEGENLFVVLTQLGIVDTEMRDALLRAVGASDKLRESIQGGTDAFAANVALQQESEAANKTAHAEWIKFQNALKNVAAEFGVALLPSFRNLLGAMKALMSPLRFAIQAFTSLPGWVQKTTIVVTALVSAIGPAMMGLAAMANAYITLRSAVGAAVIAFRAFKAEAAATGGMALVARTTAMSAAFRTMAFMLSPTGIVLTGLASLGAMFVIAGRNAAAAAQQLEVVRGNLAAIRSEVAGMTLEALETEERAARIGMRSAQAELIAANARVARERQMPDAGVGGAKTGRGDDVASPAALAAQAAAQERSARNTERHTAILVQLREARARAAEDERRQAAQTAAEQEAERKRRQELLREEDKQARERAESAIRDARLIKLENDRLAAVGLQPGDELPDGLRELANIVDDLQGKLEKANEQLKNAGARAPAWMRSSRDQIRMALAGAEAVYNKQRDAINALRSRFEQPHTLESLGGHQATTAGIREPKVQWVAPYVVQLRELDRALERVRVAQDAYNLALLNNDPGDDRIFRDAALEKLSSAEALGRALADDLSASALPAKDILTISKPLEERMASIAESSERLKNAMEGMGQRTAQLLRGFSGVAKAIFGASSGMGQLLDGLGDAVGGAADVAKQFKVFQKGGLGKVDMTAALSGVGAALGGLISIGSSLFGESEAERERKAILRQNTQAIKDLTARAQGLLVSGNALVAARGALGGMSAGQLSSLANGNLRDVVFGTAQENFLKELGLSMGQLKVIAEAAGIQIVDEQGRLLAGALKQLQAAMGPLIDTLTKFNKNSFTDLSTLAEARAQFGRYDDDPLRMFKEQVAVFEQIAGAAAGQFGIDDALAGTAEGRAQIAAGMQQLFEMMAANLLTPEMLGGFESIQQMLQAMLGLNTAMKGLEDATNKVTASMLNVPNVVSAEWARYRASQAAGMPAAVTPGAAAVMARPAGSAPTGPAIKDMNLTVNANQADPRAVAVEVIRLLGGALPSGRWPSVDQVKAALREATGRISR